MLSDFQIGALLISAGVLSLSYAVLLVHRETR